MNKNMITMICTGKHPRPTQRLASEGLHIEKLIRLQKDLGQDKVLILNNKTNFHQPGLIMQQSAKLKLH